MSRFIAWTACLAAVLFLLAPGAQAQVSKDEIVRSLKPAEGRGLTRSLTTRKIEIVPGKEAEVLDQNKDLPKVNLVIEFEFNSDRPTPLGERQLAQLGEALKDPGLKGFRFLLAGHTDAIGSDFYNQELSQRRAAAVFRYLAAHQIDSSKLNVVGFGKTRLLPGVSPDDPRNRRVEVVNLLN